MSGGNQTFEPGAQPPSSPMDSADNLGGGASLNRHTPPIGFPAHFSIFSSANTRPSFEAWADDVRLALSEHALSNGREGERFGRSHTVGGLYTLGDGKSCSTIAQ